MADSGNDRKRYRSFSSYLKQIFGCRVHKVSLDAGFTCPNRDGTRGTGGCVYCNNTGFSYNTARGPGSLEEQLERGMAYMRKRFRAEKFIAYFQAFSSTYASIGRLKAAYDSIRPFPEIAGLFISTRPDCVEDEVLELISSYRVSYLTWLELGLQSANDLTLKRINRGHTVSDFTDAVTRAGMHGLPVCAHVILGLPGEGPKEMLDTAMLLAECGVQGVKVHALHLVKNTPLAERYIARPFPLLSLREYISVTCDFLERIPPDMVVQRLGVDVPRDMLVAPEWCARKHETVSAIEDELEGRNSRQGKLFGDTA
ncbi:MAG: TIGR01212 family radical SAM protein [Gemmatimonadota bacterium]|nr:TIGR01212 family radical SAM protein [Gemmatimonadota bacterium]